MKFNGNSIKVSQAEEPSDLFWENLDYNAYKRMIRQAVVFVLTIIILLICTAALVAFQSMKRVSAVVVPTHPVWVIQNSGAGAATCLDFCEVRFFESRFCTGTGSDTWATNRVFGRGGNFENDSDGAWTQTDGFWDNCATAVASCGNSTSEDWVALEFAQPYSPNCVQIAQGQAAAATSLSLFACENAPDDPSNYSTWRPEESCVPMEDLIPHDTTSGANATHRSGVMRVKPDTTCKYTISYAAALEAKRRTDKPAEDTVVGCYCTQEAGANPKIRLPPYETKEALLCEEWSKEQNMANVRMVGSVFAVLVLNQLLLFIFSILIPLERLCTISEVTTSQMFKLFLSQFVNTGVLVVLVNANLKGTPAWFEIFKFFSIGEGNYDDVTVDWYISVGSGVVITVTSQVFSSTITPLVMSFFVTPILIRLFRAGAVTQALVSQLYVLPEWNLALRLAQSSTIIFVILMYAGGIPALYVVGILYCFIAYWLDKWCLLRGSKKPPEYNEDIIKVALNLMPISVFLHTLLTLWSFGNQEVLPSRWSTITPLFEWLLETSETKRDKYVALYTTGSDAEKEQYFGNYLFKARALDLSREACWIILVIFLVFCVYYFLLFLWTVVLGPILSPALHLVREACLKKKPKIGEDATKVAFPDAKAKMKREGKLTSYHLGDNSRYLDAHLALQKIEAHISKAATGADQAQSSPS